MLGQVDFLFTFEIEILFQRGFTRAKKLERKITIRNIHRSVDEI